MECVISCAKSQYNDSIVLHLGILIVGGKAMDKPHPYVTAALLWEKVLQEKDETVTLVRIADRIRYRLEAQGLPEGIKPIIAIEGLVSL